MSRENEGREPYSMWSPLWFYCNNIPALCGASAMGSVSQTNLSLDLEQLANHCLTLNSLYLLCCGVLLAAAPSPDQPAKIIRHNSTHLFRHTTQLPEHPRRLFGRHSRSKATQEMISRMATSTQPLARRAVTQMRSLSSFKLPDLPYDFGAVSSLVTPEIYTQLIIPF